MLYYVSVISFTGFVFGNSTGTMGEESNRNNGMDQLLLDALTARMTTVMTTLMDQRLENFGTEVVHSERERSRRSPNQSASES